MTYKSSSVRDYILRIPALLILIIIYSLTIAIAKSAKLIIKQKKINNRIIINGTFHNPNWFHAHIGPIAQSNYGEVFLITDEQLDPLPNLIYACPPKLLNKIFTRAGSKFIWTIYTGFKHPADLYVGYHIFPSAITALIASSLLGAKSCYQVTSGQLELEGGGYAAENKLLRSLRTHSSFVESLSSALVRLFDLVIVRGTEAKKYIKNTNFKNRLEVITGSVLTDNKYISQTRDIDIIFVGRIAEYKQPDIFIEVCKEVINKNKNVNVKMVGDGPLMGSIEKLIKTNNLQSNIELLGQRKDIPDLMGRSKILVLTSRWEGVSIAMLEGMALGVVPVVLNVGDLKDYVINNQTGIICNDSELNKMSDGINSILNNTSLRNELSSNARKLIYKNCDREVLARRWNNVFDNLSKK